MITERRAAAMDNRLMYCQRLACRARDLATPDSGVKHMQRWHATASRPAGIRFLPITGAQLWQSGTDAYGMPALAMAAKANQGARIVANRGVHVTDTTFSTRLGPPPSPPV
jgi:hypothetical protein